MVHYVPDALASFAAVSRSVLVTDATQHDNPIIFANAAFSALSGYSEAEAIGRNCRFLQGVDTDHLVVAEIRAAVAAGVGIRREIINYRKDGTSFWNDLSIDPLHNPAGQVTGFVSIQIGVNKSDQAKEAKLKLDPSLDSVANNIPGYMYRRIMRSDGTINVVYCSSSLSRILGCGETDILSSFYHHVHPDDRDALLTSIRCSAKDMSVFREEFRLISLSGTVHWFRSDAPPRRLKNDEIVWDGLAIEITAEKRWESEIANLAMRDPLTGLLNRESWRQSLELQLQPGEDVVRRCGVLYVDIDAFRDLNDKLGHRICDDILRQIAKRLTTIAASVVGSAGRLGGDEFAVLVPSCASEDTLSQLARTLSEALAHPIQVGAQSLSIRTCIGAALYSDMGAPNVATDKDMTSELMKQAELALRWAKQAGQSDHTVYSAALDDRFQNQAILARSLESAIENSQLELHYQPIVDLASGRILSAEALVRWNHPTLGMQRPDLFIPLAESSGLIVQLGRWVLYEAVRQHTLWKHAGLTPPRVAINVSGNQLTDPAFVSFVEGALTSLQASAQDFEIELTEGQIIEASPQIMGSLHTLRDMGFTIAIDDFGSGHATFRYLRDFPVDKLKIDQLFVRQLVLDSHDALIIRAIISLARSMGIQSVAEGIETEMQRDFLQREGCEIGQGYLFSMPLVAEDFAWMLANDVKLPLPSPAKRSEWSKIAPPDEGAHLQ